MESPGNVLVTGGSSGLGAATVTAIRKRGGTPLVIDKVAPEEPVEHVVADLADTATAEHAVHELAVRAGGLNGVFTAAGIDMPGPLGTVSAMDWERVVQVNLLATAAVCRGALPYVEETQGTIVTCASTLGLRAFPDATAYCASKFGVVGFTRALAAETAGRIGVTMLVPGGMHTKFFDGRAEQYQPPADARLNRPQDVAETVMFALSQPPGCEVRELVVAYSEEGSWP